MRFENVMQAFGKALNEAMQEAMAQGGRFEFSSDDRQQGVPLSELDMSGTPPRKIKVALHSDDIVRIRHGEALSITIADEPTGSENGTDSEASLRFALRDGTLKIMRRRGGSASRVTLDIACPAPETLSIGGSGTIEADSLAGEGRISIGGSGTIRVAHVEGARLTIKIGGSGTIEAAGQVDELDVAIGGSGTLDAPRLDAKRATVKIGGAGRTEFGCEAALEARIGGSGRIVIHGTPRCSVKASGSGKLECIPREGEPPMTAAA